MKDTTTARVSEFPPCDFCGMENKTVEAQYDARTVHGPWAYMCQKHFDLYGPGSLGLGIGQRLVLS